jgi:hypothetical protein
MKNDRFRFKMLAYVIIGIGVVCTTVVGGLYIIEDVRGRDDRVSDAEWHKQADIFAAQWAATPEGKRVLAEKARVKKMWDDAALAEKARREGAGGE